jgi:hypothetical protein
VADRLRAFFLQTCITCFHDQQGDNPTSRNAAYILFGVDSGHVADIKTPEVRRTPTIFVSIADGLVAPRVSRLCGISHLSRIVKCGAISTSGGRNLRALVAVDGNPVKAGPHPVVFVFAKSACRNRGGGSVPITPPAHS